jgi:acid phosphatase
MLISVPARAHASSAPRATAATAPHIMEIMEENTAYSRADGSPYIIGNSAAPYLNSLASTYTSATHWYANEHGSWKDYNIAISGSDQAGISKPYSAPTLVDELASAGFSWRAYMESMPSTCYTGGSVGKYDPGHDPFMSFKGISKNPAQCNNVVPYTQSSLSSDLNNSAPPDFVWISPNLCDDMHDQCGSGAVAQGDGWLTNNLPTVLASSWYAAGGIVIINWDESVSKDKSGAAGTTDTGGHIATLVISHDSSGSSTYTVAGDHDGTLRAIEEAYGVGLVGESANPGHGDLYGAFPGKAGGISGTVTDQQTGAALDGVTVACSCGAPNTTTQSGGLYAFSNVLAGTYSLAFSDANAPGYVTRAVANVTVTPGNNTVVPGVAMAEDGTASGTVTDSSSNPLDGVTVSCSCGDSNTTTVGPSGSYAFTNLAPSTSGYTLTFSAPGYTTQTANSGAVAPGSNTQVPPVVMPAGSPPPPAIVQDGVSGGATSAASVFSASFTTSTGGADLLVAAIEIDAGDGNHGATILNVSDNFGGDTWTKAVATAASPLPRITDEVWYLPTAPAGVTTVTFTFSAAVVPVIRLYELSGVGALDRATSSSSTNGSSPRTASVTITSPSEVVIGSIGWASTTATISGLTAGFSDDAPVQNTLASGHKNSEQAGNQIVSSTGSFSYGGTLSQARAWAASIVTFS